VAGQGGIQDCGSAARVAAAERLAGFGGGLQELGVLVARVGAAIEQPGFGAFQSFLGGAGLAVRQGCAGVGQ
jgi:hypothetical protein